MRKKISAIRVRNANPVAASLCDALVARKSDDKEKKLQDSDQILQLNSANSASLILRLSHARPCDAPSARCNTHEPFGRIAVALSRLCRLSQQCSQPFLKRNLP